MQFEIDPAEIGKTRRADVAVLGDLAQSMNQLVQQSRQREVSPSTAPWLEKIDSWKQRYPLSVPTPDGPIYPQEVLIALRDLTTGAIVTTDVGQHQCGQRNTCAMDLVSGSVVLVLAPWASACLLPWGHRPLSPIARWCV